MSSPSSTYHSPEAALNRRFQRLRPAGRQTEAKKLVAAMHLRSVICSSGTAGMYRAALAAEDQHQVTAAIAAQRGNSNGGGAGSSPRAGNNLNDSGPLLMLASPRPTLAALSANLGAHSIVNSLANLRANNFEQLHADILLRNPTAPVIATVQVSQLQQNQLAAVSFAASGGLGDANSVFSSAGTGSPKPSTTSFQQTLSSSSSSHTAATAAGGSSSSSSNLGASAGGSLGVTGTSGIPACLADDVFVASLQRRLPNVMPRLVLTAMRSIEDLVGVCPLPATAAFRAEMVRRMGVLATIMGSLRRARATLGGNEWDVLGSRVLHKMLAAGFQSEAADVCVMLRENCAVFPENQLALRCYMITQFISRGEALADPLVVGSQQQQHALFPHHHSSPEQRAGAATDAHHFDPAAAAMLGGETASFSSSAPPQNLPALAVLLALSENIPLPAHRTATGPPTWHPASPAAVVSGCARILQAADRVFTLSGSSCVMTNNNSISRGAAGAHTSSSSSSTKSKQPNSNQVMDNLCLHEGTWNWLIQALRETEKELFDINAALNAGICCATNVLQHQSAGGPQKFVSGIGKVLEAPAPAVPHSPVPPAIVTAVQQSMAAVAAGAAGAAVFSPSGASGGAAAAAVAAGGAGSSSSSSSSAASSPTSASSLGGDHAPELLERCILASYLANKPSTNVNNSVSFGSHPQNPASLRSGSLAGNPHVESTARDTWQPPDHQFLHLRRSTCSYSPGSLLAVHGRRRDAITSATLLAVTTLRAISVAAHLSPTIFHTSARVTMFEQKVKLTYLEAICALAMRLSGLCVTSANHIVASVADRVSGRSFLIDKHQQHRVPFFDPCLISEDPLCAYAPLPLLQLSMHCTLFVGSLPAQAIIAEQLHSLLSRYSPTFPQAVGLAGMAEDTQKLIASTFFFFVRATPLAHANLSVVDPIVFAVRSIEMCIKSFKHKSEISRALHRLDQRRNFGRMIEALAKTAQHRMYLQQRFDKDSDAAALDDDADDVGSIAELSDTFVFLKSLPRGEQAVRHLPAPLSVLACSATSLGLELYLAQRALRDATASVILKRRACSPKSASPFPPRRASSVVVAGAILGGGQVLSGPLTVSARSSSTSAPVTPVHVAATIVGSQPSTPLQGVLVLPSEQQNERRQQQEPHPHSATIMRNKSDFSSAMNLPGGNNNGSTSSSHSPPSFASSSSSSLPSLFTNLTQPQLAWAARLALSHLFHRVDSHCDFMRSTMSIYASNIDPCAVVLGRSSKRRSRAVSIRRGVLMAPWRVMLPSMESGSGGNAAPGSLIMMMARASDNGARDDEATAAALHHEALVSLSRRVPYPAAGWKSSETVEAAGEFAWSEDCLE